LVTLAEHAREAVEAERRGDRRRVMGAIGMVAPNATGHHRRPPPPERWGELVVMDRLEEAFTTLGRLGGRVWPKEFGNGWPKYVYDRADMNAQLETGELERTLGQQNRVRIPPTAAQISRCEEAIAWPARYLGDEPEIAEAVGVLAFWEARGVDVTKACKQMGVERRTLSRRRLQGLRAIAIGLIRDRVPVS
jgi:hypothetical protein